MLSYLYRDRYQNRMEDGEAIALGIFQGCEGDVGYRASLGDTGFEEAAGVLYFGF